jgi:CTP:phosphocholine cytidylyltransferase-like protein
MLKLHKFGIELPRLVKEAYAINVETTTMYWKDAFALEIKNVDVSFKDLKDGEIVPVGYQQI